VDDPARCGATLDEALAHDGPALVEAVVDPYVPPMPANITADQAAKFAESLLKGQPASGRIVRAVLKDRIRELV
jgi:pyruvate dehydrogenase (quinone)/pyruvate oxidase